MLTSGKTVRWTSRVVAWTLVGALVCAGCGGGDGDDGATTLSSQRQPLAGTVVLPAGVTAEAVINGLEEAPVTDGAFTLEVFAGDGARGRGRQLAVVVSPTGAPLLMGWFGPDATELSPRTTADVLAWWSTGAFTAPLESADALIGLFAAAPELDAVGAAIQDALAADPDAFAATHPTVTAALRTATEALLGEPGSIPRSLLVNPADERSGIRVDQLSGVNQITLTNRYRRPAFALVDRVSTFDAEGNETASPQKVARIDISAVTGLDGGVGTINQIITGLAQTGGTFEGADLAYTEKSADPIALPNVAGAKKTRYQVAVVGPGAFAGDYEALSDEAKLKQAEVVQKFVIQQLILPLTIQLLVPSGDLDKVAGVNGFNDLVQDFIGIIGVQAPGIFDLASKGDFKGAVTLAGQTIVGSGTFRNAIFAAILERLYDLGTPEGDAAYGRASAVASGFASVTGALDTFLTAFDLTAVAGSFAESNEGDRWTVDAIDSQVRLSPPSSTVEPGDNVRLTATTPDVGDDVPKAYRYTINPGNLGDLRNDRGSGKSIDSSENFIFFDAGDAPGTVTVKVEVFQIDLSNRIPLGEATATVTIEEGCEFGEEDKQTVVVQEFVGISEGGGFGGDDAAVAYWYFVWNLEPGVAPYEMTFRAGPAGDLFGSSTIHQDGKTITVRPVQPLGQYDLRYSTAASLPNREAAVFADAVALSDTQAIYILNDHSQPLNANHDQLDDFYTRVEEIGVKHRGTGAEIVPACE
ncbi:MAG: hypothetical protein IT385_27845 [Deltaproteobacteria bacterium]|nr:hypothetical protein [Deltaproteobacteria bacterium]